MPNDRHAPKSPNGQPAAPQPPPLVRQGDVLFALGQEITLAAQAVAQLDALTKRLDLYRELHPDRAPHLIAFLAGEDEPRVVDEDARAEYREAEERQADANLEAAAQTSAG